MLCLETKFVEAANLISYVRRTERILLRSLLTITVATNSSRNEQILILIHKNNLKTKILSQTIN